MDKFEKAPNADPSSDDFYIDPGPAIQVAAEKHLEQVWDAFYRAEEGEFADDAEDESPANAPFCGCSRCEVREVLAGAWPLIEKYFEGPFVSDTTADDTPA